MAYGHSSGLPPLEAPLMIAEKFELLLLLITTYYYFVIYLFIYLFICLCVIINFIFCFPAVVLRLQWHLPACAVQDAGFRCGRMPGVPEHPRHCRAGIQSDPWGLQHRCGGCVGCCKDYRPHCFQRLSGMGCGLSLCACCT